MTYFGQHSMVPPFYAIQASAAPRARTAREAPSLDKHTCKQCSNKPKDDKLLHTDPNFACGYTAQVPSADEEFFGKSLGANCTQPLN